MRALAKGLAMLSLFDAEHREWSLDEMAAALGLPRMTGYRMARTLQSAGLPGHATRSTGRYRLGPALLAATYLSEGYAELVAIARPYLESLVKQTGESATLAVEVDGVAVCVDMVDSPRPHRREVAVGRVIGDTANAHGKMFAAFKPDAERERIVDLAHERLTPNTITDPGELALELRAGRGARASPSTSRSATLGTCAVAAPVRDQTGKVIGSLGVVVPTGRFGADAAQTPAPPPSRLRPRRSPAFFGLRRSGATGDLARLALRPGSQARRAPSAAARLPSP